MTKKNDPVLLPELDPHCDWKQYVFPDGARIWKATIAEMWMARWADGTILMGHGDDPTSHSYFDTPEEPARILFNEGEGPASMPENQVDTITKGSTVRIKATGERTVVGAVTFTVRDRFRIVLGDGSVLMPEEVEMVARPSLEDLLDTWTVLYPESREGLNKNWPPGWYAVTNDDGIVAYFAREADALRFRLDQINLTLNPPRGHED